MQWTTVFDQLPQTGTQMYMAPELVAGKPASPRSDLYSVGITLYELLTGHLPITGKSPAEIIAAHLQTTPPEPNAVNPAISQSLSTGSSVISSNTIAAGFWKLLGVWRALRSRCA